MKHLIFAVAVIASANTFANELDNEDMSAAAPKAQAAVPRPEMIVVKRSKADASKVAILPLSKALAKGEKVPAGMKFAQVALNKEVKGIPFDATNELDRNTTENAWGWYGGGGAYGRGFVARGPNGGVVAGGSVGFRRGVYGGYPGGYIGAYRGGYGYGYGYPSSGYGYGYGYPSYGYSYPSYGYADSCYDFPAQWDPKLGIHVT